MKNLNQKSSVLPLLGKVFIIPLAAMLASCSHELVFATHTEVGLGVSGDLVNSVPDHITLGYRRKELAYKGKDVPNDASLMGKLDSQSSWLGEIALKEIFATGKAADVVASGGAEAYEDTSSSLSHPVIFASNTSVGMGYNLGGSDNDSLPALYMGYNRKTATRMRIPSASKAVPSVLADVSIHSSKLFGATGNAAPAGGLKSEEQITNNQDNGAMRIRQHFAIGKGVKPLLSKSEDAAKIKNEIQAGN